MAVFISYSSYDDAAVRSLAADLEMAREQVWLDQRLTGGEAWWAAILGQIRTCSVFVFAVSEHSLRSKPCQAELDYARALGLPIVPVQVGDVESYRVGDIFNLQLIDYRKASSAIGIELMGVVRDVSARRRDLPDPLPPRRRCRMSICND